MISLSKIRQLIEKEDEGPTLDYKEDLVLETNGDKAQFVKDVISLANSEGTAHIITGVEDGTRKLVGIKTRHNAEQLNQILRDKCDPPISVEYVERNIMGHAIGVTEITGESPPYIVAVADRFGGSLSSESQKSFYIERGTVFVRNYNINQGAKRADLDKMYKINYVVLQADLQLNYQVSVKPLRNMKEVYISFSIVNLGETLATHTNMLIQFDNIKEIVRCIGGWKDVSHLNNNIPTAELLTKLPLLLQVERDLMGVVIKVDRDVKQIKAYAIIGATNMRTKTLYYNFSC